MQRNNKKKSCINVVYMLVHGEVLLLELSLGMLHTKLMFNDSIHVQCTMYARITQQWDSLK